jgi:cell division septum initiation protein DivIVA
MEEKQKNSVVDKAARVWLVIGVIVLIAIAVGLISLVAGNIKANIQREESLAHIKEKRQELHIEYLKTLDAQLKTLDRLKKSHHSARTEKERASIESEWAKVKALAAEAERVHDAARAKLDTAKAELERMQ